MFYPKYMTMGAVALLAGLSFARAQMPPGPPPIGPHGPGAGPGPHMRHGMIGPGGGMRRLPGEHIEGRLAFLKAELGITDAQLPQWNAYAETRRAGAKSMRAAVTAHWDPNAAMTAPARSDAAIAVMTARLEVMKASSATGKALYAVLTDAQKKVADELMMARTRGM